MKIPANSFGVDMDDLLNRMNHNSTKTYSGKIIHHTGQKLAKLQNDINNTINQTEKEFNGKHSDLANLVNGHYKDVNKKILDNYNDLTKRQKKNVIDLTTLANGNHDDAVKQINQTWGVLKGTTITIGNQHITINNASDILKASHLEGQKIASDMQQQIKDVENANTDILNNQVPTMIQSKLDDAINHPPATNTYYYPDNDSFPQNPTPGDLCWKSNWNDAGGNYVNATLYEYFNGEGWVRKKTGDPSIYGVNINGAALKGGVITGATFESAGHDVSGHANFSVNPHGRLYAHNIVGDLMHTVNSDQINPCVYYGFLDGGDAPGTGFHVPKSGFSLTNGILSMKAMVAQAGGQYNWDYQNHMMGQSLLEPGYLKLRYNGDIGYVRSDLRAGMLEIAADTYNQDRGARLGYLDGPNGQSPATLWLDGWNIYEAYDGSDALTFKNERNKGQVKFDGPVNVMGDLAVNNKVRIAGSDVGKRFEKSENRLSGHDTTLQGHKARLDRHRKELNDHQNWLRQHDDVFNRHGQTLNGVAKSLSDDGDILTKHGRLLDADGNELDDHKYKLSKHGNLLTDHGNKISNHEKRLLEHKSRLDKHNDHLSDHDSRLDRHRGELDNHDSRISSNEGKLQKHESWLYSHDDQFDKNNKTLNQFTSQLSTDGDVLTNHGNLLDDHGKKLTNHKYILDSHGNLLNQHGGKISDHEQRLIKHKSRLDTDDNTLKSHADWLRSHDNLFTQHGQRLDGFSSTLSSEGDTLTRQGNLIGANGQQITNQSYTLGTHGNLLNSHGQRLDSHDTALINKQSQIDDKQNQLNSHQNEINGISNQLSNVWEVKKGTGGDVSFGDIGGGHFTFHSALSVLDNNSIFVGGVNNAYGTQIGPDTIDTQNLNATSVTFGNSVTLNTQDGSNLRVNGKNVLLDGDVDTNFNMPTDPTFNSISSNSSITLPDNVTLGGNASSLLVNGHVVFTWQDLHGIEFQGDAIYSDHYDNTVYFNNGMNPVDIRAGTIYSHGKAITDDLGNVLGGSSTPADMATESWVNNQGFAHTYDIPSSTGGGSTGNFQLSGSCIWDDSPRQKIYVKSNNGYFDSWYTIEAANLDCPSSLSMKTGIKDTSSKDAFSKILNTDVKAYRYKNSDNKQSNEIGPIIDDTNSNKNQKYYTPEELIKHENDHDSLSMKNTMSLLILSVQELQKQNSQLSQRVAKLEFENNK